jgi:methyl-accepting chemotaxis protein
MIAFAVFANATLRLTMVTGPLYGTIVQGKDLIADILPPPEYIIESYLISYEIDQTTVKDDISGLEKKGAALRQEYENRQAYWKENYEDGNIKDLITVDSSRYAREFFDIRDREFLPAIKSGNRESAHAILIEKMKPLYERHRSVIDEIVAKQTVKNGEDERLVADIIRKRVALEALFAAFALAVSVGASIFISVRVVRGLSALKTSLREIAEGDADLSRTIAIRSRDEIGEVAGAFNLFLGKLRAMIANFGAIGSVSSETSESLAANAERLSLSSAHISSTMESLVGLQIGLDGEIAESAVTLDVISGLTDEASNLGDDQAKLVGVTTGRVNDFVEEVNGVAADVGKRGDQAAKLAVDAKLGAERMAETTEAIRGISSSADSILALIAVIDEVAARTNLLALNAAIEAAHAGHGGKGFAVVAEEIRRLAQATARNTSEIKASLMGAIGKIRQAEEQTAGTNETITGLIDGIRDIDASMREIRIRLGGIVEKKADIADELERLLAISVKTSDSMDGVREKTETIKKTIQSLASLSQRITVGAREIGDTINDVSATIQELTAAGRTNEKNVRSLRAEIGKFRT